MSDFDLVIAGGGPVGLVTAIAARRAGLSALVIERSARLPEKACGEGLMPGGVRALASLGIELDDAAEFRGIRFMADDDVLSAPFAGACGRALCRARLMHRLDAEARASGVEIWSGHALREFRYNRGTLRASIDAPPGRRHVAGRLLVAADGLRSPIRRQLGYELPPRYAPRFGLARHFRCPPWSAWVEVYWHERAEAYVTPLGPEEVGVAVLTHGAPPPHHQVIELFPELARRLSAARERSRVRGAGPLEQRTRGVIAPGVALVGDAAGYLDALSGEGLSLGFRSAIALVERFARGELWRYPQDHSEIGRAYYALTHFMLTLSRCPRLRRHAMKGLRRTPRLVGDLVAMASDSETAPASRVGTALRAALRWTASATA